MSDIQRLVDDLSKTVEAIRGEKITSKHPYFSETESEYRQGYNEALDVACGIIRNLKRDTEREMLSVAPQPPASINGWEPIETAPKDGTPILIANGQAVFAAWWNDEADGWIDGNKCNCNRLVTYDPSHWMPLPAPPIHSQEHQSHESR